MRRCTVAFAALFGAALLDLVACNTISGVGDFTFGTASSTASSGGGPSTSTAGGTAGSTPSGGGSGGGGLSVACVKKKCAVSPDGGACCYDNLTEFTDESGRCVDGPPASDDCSASDAGRETRIECSRPGDCPTGVCCATYGGIDADAGKAWYAIVKCESSCVPADNQRVVCDPDGGGCPMTDGSKLSCTPSTILQTGYFTCK
jgi:hypothetical protein